MYVSTVPTYASFFSWFIGLGNLFLKLFYPCSEMFTIKTRNAAISSKIIFWYWMSSIIKSIWSTRWEEGQKMVSQNANLMWVKVMQLCVKSFQFPAQILTMRHISLEGVECLAKFIGALIEQFLTTIIFNQNTHHWHQNFTVPSACCLSWYSDIFILQIPFKSKKYQVGSMQISHHRIQSKFLNCFYYHPLRNAPHWNIQSSEVVCSCRMSEKNYCNLKVCRYSL